MKCMDPVLCYTNQLTGKKQYRHFSLANYVFKHLPHQVFNCGKCIFCRKKRAMELAMRCVLHASLYQHNCFLTLTYDEKKPGYHNRFEYRDIQLFKKKLRSYVKYHHNKKIEVFNVHEYGKNKKKHWHLIVFNHQFDDRTLYTTSGNHRLYTSKTLEALWPHGFNTIGDVSEASALYQAQYAQKDAKNGNTHNAYTSHSKHSGIGKPYFLRHFDQILTLGYIPFSGRKVPIPRSYLRIAHRHYSHFFEPDNFFDTLSRKAIHRPLKTGDENRLMAEKFKRFLTDRQEYIKTLEDDWDKVLRAHLTTGDKPEFLLSAENALYDLNNRSHLKDF